MLTWPGAGTPGVGEGYTVVVYLRGGTASVERCSCTEDISRSDDVREYGPFELADPKSLDQKMDGLTCAAHEGTAVPLTELFEEDTNGTVHNMSGGCWFGTAAPEGPDMAVSSGGFCCSPARSPAHGVRMDERRTHARRRPARKVIGRVAAPDGQAALLEDVSAGGVRLLTARPLPVSGLVVLDLPGLALTAARVVYAIEQEDGLWAAGCALLARLADDDLRTLGA
jgi:hypothetical protein